MVLNEMGCVAVEVLRMRVNNGEDPIDCYLPMVLQAAFNLGKSKFNIEELNDSFKYIFGGSICTPVLITMVERLKKRDGRIREASGEYYELLQGTEEPIPDEQIAKGKRVFNELSSGLIAFAKERYDQQMTIERAKENILSFLNNYCVKCLQIQTDCVRDEIESSIAIPEEQLTARYFLWIHKESSKLNECFEQILKSFVLASVYLLRNEKLSSEDYSELKLFFDTPLILQLLHYDSDRRHALMKELNELLIKYGAQLRIFSHTVTETISVLEFEARHYNEVPESSNCVRRHVISRGMTKSEFIDKKSDFFDELEAFGIVQEHVSIDDNFDQNQLASRLINAYADIGQKGNRLEYDKKSVAKVLTIRNHTTSNDIEKSKAVLVTNNTGLVREAAKFYKHDLEETGIPPVVSNYHLACITWLKDPNVAFKLNVEEFLCYTQQVAEITQAGYKAVIAAIDKGYKEGKYTHEKAEQYKRRSYMFETAQEESLGNLNALGSLDAYEAEKAHEKKIMEEGEKAGRAQRDEEVRAKDEEIAKKKEEISEKDKIIAAKDKEIADNNREKQGNAVRRRKLARILYLVLVVIAIVDIVVNAIISFRGTIVNPWLSTISLVTGFVILAYTMGPKENIKSIEQRIIDF